MGRTRKERPAGLAGELGERIEAARKARTWAAADLAERAGLGLGTVLRIEAASADAGISTVAAIARGLGLSPAELLAECPSWVKRPKKAPK